MGCPTKNDHFGVWNGGKPYHLRKHPSVWDPNPPVVGSSRPNASPLAPRKKNIFENTSEARAKMAWRPRRWFGWISGRSRWFLLIYEIFLCCLKQKPRQKSWCIHLKPWSHVVSFCIILKKCSLRWFYGECFLWTALRWGAENRWSHTLPKFNNSPLRSYLSNRKGSSSNHQFSGANC